MRSVRSESVHFCMVRYGFLFSMDSVTGVRILRDFKWESGDVILT